MKESENIFLDSSLQPQQVIYTPPNFRSPQESRDCEILNWRERLKNEPGIKQYYVAPPCEQRQVWSDPPPGPLKNYDQLSPPPPRTTTSTYITINSLPFVL